MKKVIICSIIALTAIFVGIKPNPAQAKGADEGAKANIEALNRAATSTRLTGRCTGNQSTCQSFCPGCGYALIPVSESDGVASNLKGFCPLCAYEFD